MTTKLFLTGALIIFLSYVGLTQTIALKAGPNYAMTKLNRSEYGDVSRILGFHIGATTHFRLSQHYALECDILISQKGFNSNYIISSPPGQLATNIQAKMTYLDIPLRIKGYVKNDGLNIYLFTGPYVGIGIGGTIQSETIRLHKYWDHWNYPDFDFTTGEESTNKKIAWGNGPNDDFSKIDYGAVVGFGIERKFFRIDVAYCLGLENISPKSTLLHTFKNRSLTFSISYVFQNKSYSHKST